MGYETKGHCGLGARIFTMVLAHIFPLALLLCLHFESLLDSRYPVEYEPIDIEMGSF